MEVGTLKTNLKDKSRDSRVKSLKNGFGNSNGSGGGNNGGGNDNQPEFLDSPTGTNIARIFTVFLLLVVLMTFGGLLGAYIVLATNGALEWRPFDLPYQVWVSTAIILASSFTYHLSKNFIYRGEQEKSKKWLLGTTILGAAFISSQILAWFLLIRRGIYWEANPYAGFFYILTAVHAVHVIGGICALGTIVIRTWEKTFSDDELKYRKNLANVVGWYWHFMDALWIVILMLLGFWK
ncbi:MAG: heme-copper oxidase subunit III [Pyrinomonadaceae bacterium]